MRHSRRAAAGELGRASIKALMLGLSKFKDACKNITIQQRLQATTNISSNRVQNQGRVANIRPHEPKQRLRGCTEGAAASTTVDSETTVWRRCAGREYTLYFPTKDQRASSPTDARAAKETLLLCVTETAEMMTVGNTNRSLRWGERRTGKFSKRGGSRRYTAKKRTKRAVTSC